jgi:3-oxoadipate enol-lactonase
MKPPNYQRLTIGSDPQIAAERCGSGEAIVFMHGIGGNRENWRHQFEAFSSHYSPVIFDFRGYGDSGKIDGDFNLFDLMEDTKRVMDALGIGMAHIVGLSMGGLIAQAFYKYNKRRVLSLTLAGCRPGSSPVPEDALSFSQDRLRPLMDGGTTEALADSLLPRLLGPAVTAEASAAIRDSLLRLHVSSYKAIMAARTEMPAFLDPATIHVPTQVVAGSHDKVAPVTQMQALAAMIPGCRYKVFDGTGHLINIERSDEFNAVLLDFLRSTSN